MQGLTDRQREVLDYIVEYIADEGFPPTVRDICRRFGIALNAAAERLRALEAKGVIERQRNSARAIRVLDACPTTPQKEPAV